MKSVMTHQFSKLPQVNIPRSKFDRSHGLKTTFDAGYLVPIFWDEALPGDTHILDLTAFARMATPIHPVMDNMFMDFFFFAVPIRQIWSNFQKFMGEQTDPGDSTDYTVPQLQYTNALEGSLPDYFSLPIKTTNQVSTNALYFRAYNRIWNEFFRDENLQDSLTENINDGPDALSSFTLQRRGKRHDYFTSALPWPQKGDAVEIPLGTTAPIIRPSFATDQWDAYVVNSDTLATAPATMSLNSSSEVTNGVETISFDPGNSLLADLSSASAATINTLRQAFQIQSMLERDARGGTRYTEKIQAHFGVISPDARLQRPEFLGGGELKININPVAQTSESNTTEQGNLAGYGTAGGQGVGFSASFTEHNVIVGLVSVRADLTYQQGIERPFLRQTQYDYYWPSLANIGEQTIENQEIFFDDATPANNPLTFGYQERYAEYRYKPSRITGLFRSDATASLDVWHLSQDFASLPVLNDQFIVDEPPMDRVLAVPAEPDFIYDSYIKLTSVRPMPVYGVPFNFSRL